MNELNEKLAKWAGWIKVDFAWATSLEEAKKPKSKRNSPGWQFELPDFTSSFDACFKWLWSQIDDAGYDVEISYDYVFQQWSICLHNRHWSECSIASPIETCDEVELIPLALCKAVEKLIDEEQHED